MLQPRDDFVYNLKKAKVIIQTPTTLFRWPDNGLCFRLKSGLNYLMQPSKVRQ